MPTNKPQTSQGIVSEPAGFLELLFYPPNLPGSFPNPIHIIPELVPEGTGNYIKGIWNGIWSFVTNPHVDYGTSGGGGTSIPDAIKAREGVQEILRDNQERRRNRTTQ